MGLVAKVLAFGGQGGQSAEAEEIKVAEVTWFEKGSVHAIGTEN